MTTRYQWTLFVFRYKDGKVLKSDAAITQIDEQGSTSLKFTDVDAEATGNYRVVVENDVGSHSADLYIKIKGKQEPH